MFFLSFNLNFKTYLLHILAIWPGLNHLANIMLNFFIYKMKMFASYLKTHTEINS